MITQQDIARRLGVSVTTVSLALRNDSQISEEMRAQVHALAAQMGYTYRPRKNPRSTTQIAFVGRYPANSAFYWAVLCGAEEACQRCATSLRYLQLQDVIDHRLLSDIEVDGLMVVSSIDELTIRRFAELGRPMVLIDNNLPMLGLDRVLIENYWSFYRATLKMADWGHRSIALLRGPDAIPSFHERALGYLDAMATLGLPPHEIPCPDPVEIEGVREAIGQWLTRSGRPQFTVLLACSDKAAIGALHALHDHDLRVPDDISVTGFDDIDMAEVVRPSLTTIHVYRELLGELGVQMLLERIHQPSRPPIALTVDTAFVERESARPLK